MTLYIPKYFEGTAADTRAVIEGYPFATLITQAPGGPFITHLPLLLDGDVLIGHLARANPHWRAFPKGETVAVFQGPHAFVSRGWYPDAANNVPTWNFAAVHVTGTPELCEGRPALEQLEARFESPALPKIAEEKMAGLVNGIVAFRLPMTRVDVKLKFSQNKTKAELDSLVAGLRATGAPESATAAEWMLSIRAKVKP